MTSKKHRPVQPPAITKGLFVNRRVRYLHRPRHPRYPNWAGITSLIALALALLYIVTSRLELKNLYLLWLT
jgi:hypothetical protein